MPTACHLEQWAKGKISQLNLSQQNHRDRCSKMETTITEVPVGGVRVVHRKNNSFNCLRYKVKKGVDLPFESARPNIVVN